MSGRGEPGDYASERVLREQLFHYAEDRRPLMSDHADLGWRYHLLAQAYFSLGGGRAAIDRAWADVAGHYPDAYRVG